MTAGARLRHGGEVRNAVGGRLVSDAAPNLKQTVLWDLHRRLGARMAGFGGYDMPIQYPLGVLGEHNWTREKAGLFDVSHMGPCWLELTAPSGDPAADFSAVAALIERVFGGDVGGLAPGQLRYGCLLAPDGGILDDLFVGRHPSPSMQHRLYVIVNAGTKEADFALIEAAAGGAARLIRADDGGLIALQGPAAKDVIVNIAPGATALGFMTFALFESRGFGPVVISRSGYTGEDGFEILVGPDQAEALAALLLAHAAVKPIGLGARDSLRLEAGLHLYGHDMDATRSPVEAGLAWTIQKARRARADFPGAARILREFAEGTAQKRVGLKMLDKAPAREGATVLAPDGAPIGVVTSGGFGPTAGGPIALAYVAAAHAAVGTRLSVLVRDQPRAAEVVSLPFVPHRYVRKGA